MVFGISLWIMRRQWDNSAIQSEFNPQIINMLQLLIVGLWAPVQL